MQKLWPSLLLLLITTSITQYKQDGTQGKIKLWKHILALATIYRTKSQNLYECLIACG